MNIKSFAFCGVLALLLPLSSFIGGLFGNLDLDDKETIILRIGNGRTFSNQVTSPNTVYVIRYGFDLRGEKVVIPPNCVLKFSGGYVCNGALEFSDTYICGRKTKHILNNINVSGKIKGDCYAEWFVEDDLLKTFTIADKRVILEKERLYNIKNDLVINGSDYELCGNKATILYDKEGVKLSLNGKNGVIIKDLILDGNNKTNHGVSLYRCSNIKFQNITVKNISWDSNTKSKTYCYGIEMVACHNMQISNCIIEDVKGTPTCNVAGGIVISISGLGETSKNITINNCIISRIWSENNGIGFGADCVVLSGRYREDKELNAVIRNCTFTDFTKRGVKAQAGNVTVSDCNFSFTSFMDDKEDAKYAIEIFGSNSTVTNNNIVLKKKKCGSGICVYGQGKTAINNGNLIFDEQEITKNISIIGNTIEADHMSYGILIGEPLNTETNLYKDVFISDNLIKGDVSLYYGIRAIDPVESCTIIKNKIINASTGIWINSPCKTITSLDESLTYYPSHSLIDINHNDISGPIENQQFGILFDKVDDSQVSNNRIHNYKNGIKIGSSNKLISVANCNINKNIIKDCAWGVETGSACESIKIIDNIFENSSITDMTLVSGGVGFIVERNKTPKGVHDETKHIENSNSQ